MGNGGVERERSGGRRGGEEANGNIGRQGNRRFSGERQEMGRDWRGDGEGEGGERGLGIDYDHQGRRVGRGGRRGEGESTTSRSGEEAQRSPMPHRQVDYGGYQNNSLPLQSYSTQV